METPEQPRRKRKRPPRSTIALRWAAVAALAIVAFLYYRPLRTYVDTKRDLRARAAEVQALRAQKRQLQRQP